MRPVQDKNIEYRQTEAKDDAFSIVFNFFKANLYLFIATTTKDLLKRLNLTLAIIAFSNCFLNCYCISNVIQHDRCINHLW